MSLPLVTLEGGLVKDPELRFTPAGKGWAALRVACKDRVRGQNGEWTDGPTTYIDVVVFGKAAENITESASIGDTITVSGRLQQNDYERQDGTKVTSYRIVADHVGVSMLWNPAKTPRTLGEGGGKKAAAAGDNADPWGGGWEPQAQTDEPPF